MGLSNTETGGHKMPSGARDGILEPFFFGEIVKPYPSRTLGRVPGRLRLTIL